MRQWAIVVLSILLLAAPSALQAQDGDVIIFLVRHSERAEDGSDDPPISQEGWARARMVTRLLQDSGITHIHSTDYQRTRQTATPTSGVTGVDIQSYDPRDLPAFAGQLRETPGRHLVVGHSNTTPQLVEALGGDSHGPIAEFEYDRLYMVVISGEQVSTVLIRFGEPYIP
jgi:phosphohistidine phosphatase SixA